MHRAIRATVRLVFGRATLQSEMTLQFERLWPTHWIGLDRKARYQSGSSFAFNSQKEGEHDVRVAERRAPADATPRCHAVVDFDCCSFDRARHSPGGSSRLRQYRVATGSRRTSVRCVRSASTAAATTAATAPAGGFDTAEGKCS